MREMVAVAQYVAREWAHDTHMGVDSNTRVWRLVLCLRF